MQNRQRKRTLRAIQRYYQSFYEQLEKKGEYPYRMTSRGAWAASNAEEVYDFFASLHLEKSRLFIDLGSGDGVVVCLASLFTRAVGIEIDRFLCRTAVAACRRLGLLHRTQIVCADFLNLPVWKADCLYLYPDKPFQELENRLSDWQGMLLVYGHHFPPTRMIPIYHLQSAKARLLVYTNPGSGSLTDGETLVSPPRRSKPRSRRH